MTGEHADAPAYASDRLIFDPRQFTAVALITCEVLIFSFLARSEPLARNAHDVALAYDIHRFQHILLRFLIVYLSAFAVLVIAAGKARIFAAQTPTPITRFEGRWVAAHGSLVTLFFIFFASAYQTRVPIPLEWFAVVRGTVALAAVLTLCAAVVPPRRWWLTLGKTGWIPLIALVMAVCTLAAYQASEFFWSAAARLTFMLVQWMSAPFYPTLHADLPTLTLSTHHFAVIIENYCSGLEGMGLMLVFCSAWLWYGHRDYEFPRALVLLPLAMALMFALNAARIAVLLAIGDAGYPRIANVGFHSQAGWIAFNLVAVSVAFASRNIAWFHRVPSGTVGRASGAANFQRTRNPVVPYVVPLLVILCTGMLTRALSDGFDWLYPVRLLAGLLTLWILRRRFKKLNWRFSWLGVTVGAGVFLLWETAGHFITVAQSIPVQVRNMPPIAAFGWILCRTLGAVITVPIAEELAYRGYLMRRLARADFESVLFREIGFIGLVGSAIAFGVLHGVFWWLAIVVGLAYGLLTIKSGRFGEAVAAHAPTNLLLAAYVLIFGQWQLW